MFNAVKLNTYINKKVKLKRMLYLKYKLFEHNLHKTTTITTVATTLSVNDKLPIDSNSQTNKVVSQFIVL